MFKSVAQYTNIVLHDGVCNFCNESVNLIMKLDHQKIFYFCSLQSEKGMQLMSKYKGENNLPIDLSSIIYMKVDDLEREMKPIQVYQKSDAVIQIAQHLGVLPRVLSNLLCIFPKFVRDRMYDFVGRHRYSIFGRSEVCRIPRKEDAQRFLK
jgi:predicted DCC family thiol-disulfide oxidoreductase YuxK